MPQQRETHRHTPLLKENQEKETWQLKWRSKMGLQEGKDKDDVGEDKSMFEAIQGSLNYQNKSGMSCNSFSPVLARAILIFIICSVASSNGIYMSLNSSNQYVGSSSTYSISFNRSLNTLGQPITQSALDSNYFIAVIFDSSYNISSSIAITPNTYNLNANAYTATLTLTAPITSITVTSIVNPLPSQTPLKITLNFYNLSTPTVIVDTCSVTLTFQSLSLSSSAVSYAFTPGNVSTQSNLTVSFIPFIWKSSQMAVKLNFLTYWARNMLNVSANQVLSSMSYCLPACTISNMGSFFLIQFNAITLTGTTISLTIYNILSPATLEPADTITITIIQNTYSTAVQTGSVAIAASAPNNFQVLTATTTSTIGNAVTLSLSITSQDLFSSADSIIIVMNTSVAMASTVTIANILVASNDVSVQQNSIITLSNFILVTNIPGQFSGTITITNISSQSSIRPITGSKISLYRNGYLYDQSLFSFSVNQAAIKNISLTLSSYQANANANLTVSVSLTYGVTSTDFLFVNVDQAITVYTCSVISCATCSCLTTFANPSIGVFSNLLKITNFAVSALTSDIIINLAIKNPISSNYLLYFATTDAYNYTKQTGNQKLPNITQSVIPSSIFYFSNTANTVYQATNFTIGLNFSGYSLLNGWMTVTMDFSITLLDQTNTICIVNGNNGACTLTVVNGSITANISISSLTQFYTVVINNLRNPTSTKYFSFKVAIYDTSNLPYYTLVSSNYQVTTPYSVTPQITSANCINSASNTLNILFPYLPFTPSSALMVDDSSAPSLKGESILKKLVYPVNFSSNISLTVTNSFSLQPIYYQIMVVTNDLLYSIFSFSFTITNCNPNNLSITSFAFTGLPENSGTLAFVINQVMVQNSVGTMINGINYLTVLFPSDYSSNMSISSNVLTSQLGPRNFNLTVGNTQPISINIWGFTNVLSSSVTIQAYSQSQSGQFSYLVSSNAYTIRYNLSVITNCTFPCKICTSLNYSTCLQCYSSATTQYYFIDPVAQNCVTPSTCSSNTYPNYAANACVVCPPQCLTCSSSSACHSCATNYYLLNNSCLTDCPGGYYPVTIQQVCSPCNSVNNTAHCSECISLNVCSTCLYPYNLSPSTKTCVTACLANEIPLNSTCFACQTYCSTCQGSTANCTSCVSSYYLLSNGCVSSCPSPYVPSASTSDCVNCSSICLLCTGTPITCTSCRSPLKLYNSTCVDNCPLGYYSFTASNSTQQCLSCPLQCSSCNSATNCSTCLSPYFFYNYNCLSSCPISTYSSNQTASSVCLPCISYCLTCTSPSICSQCQNGFYISPVSNGSICVSACSLGQYLNGNICQNCPSNCVSCLDSTLCLLCSTAYSLQNSLCVSNCSSGSVSILDTVSLPSSNNTAYVCKACALIFQYCSSCLSTSCSLCQTGYIMNYDRSCVAICPSGYLNVSSLCVTCSQECKACANLQNNCTTCSQGYLLYKNASSNVSQCLVGCISGTYALNGVCLACTSPCQTCLNASTSCLSCMAQFYSLINNGLTCVSSCPANSYVYNNNCVYCSSGCSLCDANGCLTCSPLYYQNQGTAINGKTYYDCYTTCPPTLPFLVNNTCLPCAANCQICTSSNCFQCVNGTYAYQLYCLIQCPPAMMPSAGVCIPIPENNQSNSTNGTLNSTMSSTSTVIPVPFSISCVVVMGTVMVSKLSHPHTSISLAIFSLISVVAIICNLFYLIRSLSFNLQQSMYSVILIVGLLINYINNVIFLFVCKYTLLRDHEFNCWRRGNVELIKEDRNDQPSHNNLEDHLNSDFRSELNDNKVPQKFYTYECVWYLVVTVGMLSSQSLYSLVFSKLFDLSIFKAAVESVKNLKIMNYVWVVALLAHLLCLLTGVVEAVLTSPTSSHYLQRIYQSVDLIFLNFVCLVFGLLLLRKKRELWERNLITSNHEDANSTKKVIFDHESHSIHMNGQVGNQSEVNGRIKNLLGTENAGSEQDIVGAEYKSSTVEQASALYFEKDEGENLDNTQEIKMDNNILWMQIHPDEMAPQLIEKDDSHLFEESANPTSPPKNTGKDVLLPDNNLEVLDMNKIHPDEPSSAGEQERQQERESERAKEKIDNRFDSGQNGEEWLMNSSEEGEQQTNIPRNKLNPGRNGIQSMENEVHSPIVGSQDEHQHEVIESQDFDLPEIAEDAENNERDDHQFNHPNHPPIKREPSDNHHQSPVDRLSLSKGDLVNPANSVQLKPSEEERNIQFKEQMKQDDDLSLHNSDQDYNIEEQLKNMQQNQLTLNKPAAPLQSDHLQSINKEQIANIIQNQLTVSKPESEFRQFPRPQRRQIKTEQGNRKRRTKQESQSRYVPQQDLSNAKQSKETSKMSGLYELFDQYQSQSSSRIAPNQVQNILNQQSLSIHDNTSDHESPPSIHSPNQKASPLRKNRQQPSSKTDRKRYMNGNACDSIKEEANELRMSNSAHNFTNKFLQNEIQKQEFKPMLHENSLKREDSMHQGNYRTMNHTKTLEVGESQALKKSIYKSINIAKINNRLGTNEESFGLKTVSKDHYTPALKSQRGNRSASRNNFSSRKVNVNNVNSNLSQSEKKSVWKSRVVAGGSKEHLDGTAKIIERKSKLAEVKAKLESIYLPNK